MRNICIPLRENGIVFFYACVKNPTRKRLARGVCFLKNSLNFGLFLGASDSFK